MPLEGPRGEQLPYRLEVHVQEMERAEKSSRGTERGQLCDAAPDAVVRIAISPRPYLAAPAHHRAFRGTPTVIPPNPEEPWKQHRGRRHHNTT